MDRQRAELYLTAKEAGASRLTEQNVILTNPFEHIDDITGVSGTCLQGTGAVAITQEMVATSDVNQAGIAFTYNDASGKSVTRSTMMDFNGDGSRIFFKRESYNIQIRKEVSVAKSIVELEPSAARTSLKDGHWEVIPLFR